MTMLPPNTMRAPLIVFSLALMVGVLTTGCYSFSTVRYPGVPAKKIPPDGIQIGAERDRFVVFGTLDTNSGPSSVLEEESWLRDSAGRHYRLVFERPTRPESLKNMFRYEVRAYGPSPSSELHLLTAGKYDLCLAYIVDGRRIELRKVFIIKRHYVPFFVVWTARLLGMH